MSSKGQVMKRGTKDWWIYKAMVFAANRFRKKADLPPGSPVILDTPTMQAFLRSVDHNPLKRWWILLTCGDVRLDERNEVGDNVMLPRKDGELVEYYRPPA